MTITLRLDKGSELTFQELDNNFTDLNSRLNVLETTDTDNQTLTLNGTTLSISNGNSVDLGSVSASVSIGDSAPITPEAGDLWWQSDVGRLRIYYTDTVGSQWVDASPTGAGGGGSNVTVSDDAPGTPVTGDLWWESDIGKLRIYYNNVWVDAAPSGTGGSAGGDLSISSISELSDVDFNSITLDGSNGQNKVLAWDEALQSFVPRSTAVVTVSDVQPATPVEGDLWWESDVGKLRIYYNDGVQSQWVDANPAGTGVDLDDLNVVTSRGSTTTNTITVGGVVTDSVTSTGTISSDTSLRTQGNIEFEGSTNNAFETRLQVVDPTQDNTITFQNASGTVAFLSDIVGGGGSSYTDSDVDTHLNTSTATANQILSWTGTDYAWVADQTGGSGGVLSLTGHEPAVNFDFTGDGSVFAADALDYAQFAGGESKTEASALASDSMRSSWSPISGAVYTNNQFGLYLMKGNANDALIESIGGSVNGWGDTILFGNVNDDGTSARMTSGLGITGNQVYLRTDGTEGDIKIRNTNANGNGEIDLFMGTSTTLAAYSRIKLEQDVITMAGFEANVTISDNTLGDLEIKKGTLGVADAWVIGIDEANTEASSMVTFNVDGNSIWSATGTALTVNPTTTFNGAVNILGGNNLTVGTVGGAIIQVDGAGVLFGGATSDANTTTLTVTDPTAVRTITLPDASGTVALLSDISGGGANVTVQDTAPAGTEGDLWWESDVGTLKIYYDSTWIDASPAGGSGGSQATSMVFTVHNDSGGVLTKGEVVYISGLNGNTPEVSKAQANSSITMPAFGIVKDDIANTADGTVITFGSCPGHDVANFGETGITFGLGDTLYVSASEAGKLTNVAPAGEANLIQNIGKIERATPTTNMTLKVGGAGRTNATPALDEGNIFIGDAQNRSSTVSFNSTVDTHLNTSTATASQVLSWNGSDYAWVADQTGGGSGLQSRGTVTGTTGSLADAAEADLDITGFKSYALLTITTDRAARVRLYVSAATRTADASRAEGVDPTSDAGLIAEVITTGADTVIISPGAYGFNLESTPTTTIPCRVTNKSGGTATVQVTLNVLQLEA